MLCGVLINAPVVRHVLLEWMGRIAGANTEQFDTLSWDFDTELSIGSKRDDLRIEGWIDGDEASTPIVLWTIEVKVAARIHQSSEQLLDEDNEKAPVVDEVCQGKTNTTIVSQIQNYDHWLAKQEAEHRAGFVLAVTDQAANLNAKLQMQWHCETWTNLALEVERALANDCIPASEKILALHLCGFIRDHLWHEVDMLKSRFNFDDLALLRAFSAIGNDCFRKVDGLVAKAEPIILDLLQGCYASKLHRKALKNANNRSAIFIKFLSEVPKGPISPALFAGIEEGKACVCLESSPRSPSKLAIHKLLPQYGPQLRERNPEWELVDETSEWSDLQIYRPLEWILASEDQQAALNKFIESAITDLIEVGFIKALTAELKSVEIK